MIALARQTRTLPQATPLTITFLHCCLPKCVHGNEYSRAKEGGSGE